MDIDEIAFLGLLDEGGEGVTDRLCRSLLVDERDDIAALEILLLQHTDDGRNVLVAVDLCPTGRLRIRTNAYHQCAACC